METLVLKDLSHSLTRLLFGQWSKTNCTVCSPGAPLTNFNDGGGGVRQRFIFYTQKNYNFRICLPKKITTFYSVPKKNPLVLFSQPKKIPLFFFATQKNPGVFHRPKKITFGQNFRPKKITRTPPSLKYVSGAPGVCTFCL